MKGKQLLILLVLAIALGGAWLALSKRNQSSWSESSAGGKVIEFPINDVTHVVLKDANAEVNLVKKGDDWTVKERADYPASFEQVSNLLRKLWDLKSVQEVKVGPSQFSRLELVEPGKDGKTGTVIRLLGSGDKAVGALLVGKKQMRKSDGGEESPFGGGDMGGIPVGRYVKPLDGTKVSLVSETLDEVEVKPEHWLNKDFFAVQSPKAVTVAGPTEPQKWSVSRESASGEWKLADAKPDEKIDTSKASPLGSLLSTASFSDVLAPDAKLEEPIINATVETFDGFRYELKIGKPNGENYPVSVKVSGTFAKERTPGKDEKPEDKTRLDAEFATKIKGFEEKLAKEKKVEGRIYLIAKYAIDPLLRERSGLLADKPAAPAIPTDSPAPAPSAASAPVSVTTPPMTAPAPAPKPQAATAPVQAPAAPKPAAPAPAASTPKPAATPAPATPPAPPAPPQ